MGLCLGRHDGLEGPWQDIARNGLDFALSRRRKDGQIPTLIATDGHVLDETATLYDQTFLLLALSEAVKQSPDRQDLRDAAHLIYQTTVTARRNPGGGFVENAEQVFQSNPHMHLLEATLAWREVEPGGIWDAMADEVAQLGLSQVDGKNGAIREFYCADWNPVAGAAGRSVEPGHQFEWAWLLGRWAKLRGNKDADKAARRLFEIGSKGVDPKRCAAMDELDDEFRPVRPPRELGRKPSG